MATAILRHESLSFRHPFPLGSRRKRFESNNRRESESMVTKPPAKNLVMGQVKILKRGEPLVAAAENTDGSRGGDEAFDFSLGSTNRLGPDPETMQKQIKLKEFKIGGGFYASSSSFNSPPPSSVPVPGFLGRAARVSP
ncbi:hypothetical protein Godav_004075 [Gossypium davidsonii]|uniref:Uncharacterized protein n=2 Tax=Gossypium TaxID=3633 RepID=A0A7J8SKG5_GOSDV|nr:hypothetical protein [Gossypium davidsonii]MBA0662012.1 hypothetical protein [Gossypium klotzschianum]